ncbi:MAG: MBL fold metallo-hydrolase [Pseudomonadota bacterium]
MTVKITVLCENTTYIPETQGEHGFSAFIETDSGNYLFDTGQGDTLIDNALSLGKDLLSLKKVFLSHGHYDHTGGLLPLLEVKKRCKIVAHPDIFLERFWIGEKDGNVVKRSIGLKHDMEALKASGAEFLLEKKFHQVEEGLFLTGEVPRLNDFEKGDPNLFIYINGELSPDIVPDDQSLVIHTEKGKGATVVLGCAHSGVVNILNYVRKMLNDRISCVIGGTHLASCSEEQLGKTIEALKEHDVEKIGLSHCTGAEVSLRLAEELGNRVFFGNVGISLVV